MKKNINKNEILDIVQANACSTIIKSETRARAQKDNVSLRRIMAMYETTLFQREYESITHNCTIDRKLKRLNRFYQNIALLEKFNVGNCAEFAEYTLYQLALFNYPGSAEMFSIENGDHMFIMLDRHPMSDEFFNNSIYSHESYGDECMIFDTWAAKRYNLSDVHLLRDYSKFARKNCLKPINWIKQQLIKAKDWPDLEELRTDNIKIIDEIAYCAKTEFEDIKSNFLELENAYSDPDYRTYQYLLYQTPEKLKQLHSQYSNTDKFNDPLAFNDAIENVLEPLLSKLATIQKTHIPPESIAYKRNPRFA